MIKHQLHWKYYQDDPVTTLWVAHAGPPTQAMVDADRAEITAWATASWRGVAWNQAALHRIKSWDFSVSPPSQFPPLDLYPAAPIVGNAGNVQFETPALTLAISLRTGGLFDKPRPPHGRIYHVGTVSSTRTGPDAFSTTADALDTCYTALLTRLDGSPAPVGQWSIISFWSGGTRAAPVLRPEPLVLPIARIYVSPQWAVQRRRRTRREKFATN